MNRRNFLNIGISLSFASLLPSSLMAKDEALQFNKKTRKAVRLQPGDKIGITTPGFLISEEGAQQAIENITKLGFEPIYTNMLGGKNGYFCGTDKERADELNAMIKDPEIKGIIFARGGYGCARILDMIDYKALKKNPKVIMGFSDITALINAINQKTGLVTFHGPIARTLHGDYNIEQFSNVVLNPTSEYVIESTEEDLLKAEEDKIYERYVITQGKAIGELVGGNLTLICSMMGTPYEIDMKGKIVMIEDVGEEPYRIDRMLTQLIASGQLSKAAGIVFGISDGCERSEKSSAPNSFTLREVIEDRIKPLDIPAVHGLSFGHVDNNFTFPIGIKAELDTDSMTITLLEEAVS